MSALLTHVQKSSTPEEPFADFPFLKVIAHLFDPISCQKLTICPYNFYSHYVLSDKYRDIIRKSWNSSKNEYKIQVVLRVIQTNPDENIKHMPYYLKVVVNGVDCKLPELSMPSSYIGDQWRYSIPINITDQTLAFNSSVHELKIIWNSTSVHFKVILSVIEKFYPEELIVKLKEKPLHKFEFTKKMVIKSMKKDNEISVDSFVTTLMDPLTQTRMKLPTRGVNCTHLQCFDGLNFLQLKELCRNWICPTCTKKLDFKDIRVDEFFLNIIQSKNLSKDCETVVLYNDGSWSEENKESLRNSKVKCSSDIEVTTLSDTDSDNDVVYPAKRTKRKSEYLTETSNDRRVKDPKVTSTTAENPPNRDFDDLSTSRGPVSTICPRNMNNGQERPIPCIQLD